MTPLYKLASPLFGAPETASQDLVSTLLPFFKGEPGASATEAQISTDAGNMLTLGTDGKLLVPGGDYDYDALVATNLPL